MIEAVLGIARAANAILSFIPALVWACALAVATMYGGFMHHERDHAVSEKNVIQASFEALTAKVVRQNNAAAALLKKLTEARDVLQAQVNDAHKAQEIKDANAAQVIAAQAARLRALAPTTSGGQLRDPNAAGGCRPGAAGGTASAAGGGEDHGAEAGGLLSAPLSGLLLELTGEADAINRAYAAARADALMCRLARGTGLQVAPGALP